jgi:holo-[acyl-carrier protein] synthase
MILGIGCDIVNAERFRQTDQYLEHLANRLFSDREKEAFRQRHFACEEQKTMYVAKRFAAKEAVAKALGTGFRNGLHLSDIEIFNDAQGKPFVVLNSSVLTGEKYRIHLSLSDDTPYAEAVALIED